MNSYVGIANMDMPTNWRKDMSLSERLGIINSITRGWINAHGTSTDEAQAESRSIEAEYLKNASSKEDYHRLCSLMVATLSKPSVSGVDQAGSIVKDSPSLNKSSKGPAAQTRALDADDHLQSQINSPYAVANSHEGDAISTIYEPDTKIFSEECSSAGQQVGPYAHAIFYTSGAFSTVYKASSGNPSQLLALKVTSSSMSKEPHNPLREARILQRAVHHSVVRLLSTSTDANGHLILVFPFLPLDLEALIGQKNSAPERLFQFAPKLLHNLFSALAHIHSLGIIHRDVKPANVLLASPEGPAYLADFGIAWMPSDESGETEPASKKITDVGTTCYRPPELLFGHTSYGCALDMWAAGCVTAEVFLGNCETLFKSGELGSDLALIFSIFNTLGTPTSQSWPEAANFPSWGKIQFHLYPGKPWHEILPLASEEVRDLVKNMVAYDSNRRLTASAVLTHRYFAGVKA